MFRVPLPYLWPFGLSSATSQAHLHNALGFKRVIQQDHAVLDAQLFQGVEILQHDLATMGDEGDALAFAQPVVDQRPGFVRLAAAGLGGENDGAVRCKRLLEACDVLLLVRAKDEGRSAG